MMMLVAGPALAAKLTGLAIAPGQVTIATDGPVAAAQGFALDGPYRLVVDLPAVIDAPMTAAGINSVAGLRLAMFAPGTARLVIDLKAPVLIVSARAGNGGLVLTLARTTETEFAALVARGRRPLPVVRDSAAPPPTLPSDSFDLPSDMFGRRGAADAAAPVVTPVPPAAMPAAMPPATPSGAPARTPVPDTADIAPAPAKSRGVRPRSGGKPLVVIDAGHGGKDVGAISVKGGYEKDVTLAIARLTAARLQKTGRVRVKLTRDGDTFVPLGGRVRIARNAKADLFVSIHADSAPNEMARGASVYTLSAVASDAIAARLAARENKADIIGGVNLGVEAPEVGDIMVDLVRRATGNVSVQFAEVLQSSLERQKVTFRGEFHHFAAFAVLKAPDVPSVLLETGYVTNADDAEFLFSDEGRRSVAAGIADAVQRHLLGEK